MAKTPKSKVITQYSDEYALYRVVAPFGNLNTADGNIWRSIARSQPIVMDCISALTMRLQSLPYSIRARDANRADELQEDIEYHLEVFKNAENGDGFVNFVDAALQDLYMTPFGGAIEAVRYSDKRLYSFRTVDAATMYLSNDSLMPYYQYVPEVNGKLEPVYFTRDEMVRIYQSPRNELYVNRRGWQMPPTERAYLALEMLNRGDRYYANLLLDTPEAGLLDLGDMSRESAEAWLKSFRDSFTGIDGFKIPVIFEHTTPAKYIPFGRPPTDLLFNEIGIKYAQILVAAFGLTLGDIGMKSTSGGSLSGEMRDERHAKSTGYASAKILLTDAMNKLLPSELEFWFIDVDDEILVAKGRARSANAVAMRNLIEAGLLEPKEGRAQLKADGLLTIPLPEQVDVESFDILKEINGTADQYRLAEAQLELQKDQAEKQDGGDGGTAIHVKGGQGGIKLGSRRNMRGGKLESVQGKDPVAATSGGFGEVKSLVERADGGELRGILADGFDEIMKRATGVRLRRILRLAYRALKDKVNRADYSEDVVSRMDVITRANGDNNLFDELKDKWYYILLDEDEIFEYLKREYTYGMQLAITEMQYDLYENGLSDDLSNHEVEITNEDILAKLHKRAKELKELVNSGTEYYLNRLTMLAILDYYEDGLDEDTVVNLSESTLISLLTELFVDRSDKIAEYETKRARNGGGWEEYSRIGLTQKRIIHIGSDDPCVECQEILAMDWVEMDYLYLDKFGNFTKFGPFHIHCHCVPTYKKGELYGIENVTYYLGS